MVGMALREPGRLRRTPDKPIDLLSPMRRPTDPEVDQICFSIDDQAQTRHLPQRSNRPRQQYPDRPARGARLHLRLLIATFARPALCLLAASQPNHRTHGTTSFIRSFPASRTPTPANRRVQTTLSPAPSHRRQASRTGFAWLAQDPLCRKIQTPLAAALVGLPQ